MAIVRFLGLCTSALVASAAVSADPAPLARAEGYRGCWYSVGPTKNEYAFKYSGGLATYPQQHAPIAIHCEAVRKTFFVYGGANPAANSILHMISYFDHETNTVPRPAILLDKKTEDAHDNPTLAVDKAGHLWVFSNAHGTGRPSYVHRGTKPYSIDAFERIVETNFSYGCPWVLPDGTFVLMHTKYKNGRGLHVAVSPDGRTWPEPTPFVKIEGGDYQISTEHNGTIATAFDHHPAGKGLDYRTNLYYLASSDGAKTWRTADGTAVALPVSSSKTPALVRDFAAEKKLVYLKDLTFDAAGRPVILYLTSKDHKPGPAGGPHEWHTARWDGSKWQFRPVTTSDHNYDHGSLTVEADGTWRIIAPFGPGPQPFGTGGDMQMWTSRDMGETWVKVKDLTTGRLRNHTYARRPRNAHPDFYALWADGDARKKSESDLYVGTKAGEVFRLPRTMAGETATLERMK